MIEDTLRVRDFRMRSDRFLSAIFLFSAGVFGAAQSDDPQLLINQLRQKAAADKSEAQALALAYGIPIRHIYPDGTIIELAMFRNGKPIYRRTDNVNAAKTTRANRVHPSGGAGLSLTGTGIILGEWDGGPVRSTHTELSGHVTVIDGGSAANHATHVAGTMVAKGTDATAKGMAWGASVKSFDWDSDSAEMATEAAAGMLASNHSYGYISGWAEYSDGWYWYGDRVAGHSEEAGFGYYNDIAHDWDQIVYDHPNYNIFKSAGNDRGEGPSSQPLSHYEWDGSAWKSYTVIRPKDGGASGYDTISYNGVAKNMITVGAVDDVLSYTGPASVVMSSFSGWGPTDDGRIKPDIVANGVALHSSVATSDTAYGTYSGTSMASPDACGSTALILQHYKALNAGAPPRSDVVRGLLIHTADECGSNPGPDYAFGWGLMNTEAACALISDNASGASPRKGARIRYAQLSNGETRQWPVKRSTSAKMKVTICWVDKPGTPAAWSVDPTAHMLVNDLDLRVIAPNGTTTYYPWKLNPASPSSAATKGDNDRDNVEQVIVDTPVTGTYKIQVKHKGTFAAIQNFVIITDNAEPVSNSLTSVTVTPTSVFGGTSATGTVNFNMGSFFQQTVTMSDTASDVTMLGSVPVFGGKSSQSFNITTTPRTTDEAVTITAVCNGVTKTCTLNVWAKFAIQSLWMNKTRVIGGSTPLGGTAMMNHPNPIEATLALTDDSPALNPPASVLVGTGVSSVTFTIPTSVAASDHTATLSGTIGGVTKTATVTVITAPNLNAVTISPSTVTGGTSTTGKVYFDKAAPTGGVLISITDNKAAIITPATALIPSLQWFGDFQIDTTTVTSSVVGTVSATYRGVTKTKTLTVNP